VLHSDSELIVNQCSGIYGCREPRLRAILDLVEKAKEKYTRGIIFKWIPREKNKEADALSRSLYTEEMLAIMRANKENIIHNWDDVPW
jgi:ribonuclease HI